MVADLALIQYRELGERRLYLEDGKGGGVIDDMELEAGSRRLQQHTPGGERQRLLELKGENSLSLARSCLVARAGEVELGSSRCRYATAMRSIVENTQNCWQALHP
jgi:hypothetical protein